LVLNDASLELAKWAGREAVEEMADEVIAFSESCVVADLSTETALAAADLCARYRLATADAVIYATALAFGADLLTCCGHFENLPFVRFVPKRGGPPLTKN
jgi:predicted nucleic acid-binding protein